MIKMELVKTHTICVATGASIAFSFEGWYE